MTQLNFLLQDYSVALCPLPNTSQLLKASRSVICSASLCVVTPQNEEDFWAGGGRDICGLCLHRSGVKQTWDLKLHSQDRGCGGVQTPRWRPPSSMYPWSVEQPDRNSWKGTSIISLRAMRSGRRSALQSQQQYIYTCVKQIYLLVFWSRLQ